MTPPAQRPLPPLNPLLTEGHTLYLALATHRSKYLGVNEPSRQGNKQAASRAKGSRTVTMVTGILSAILLSFPVFPLYRIRPFKPKSCAE